METAPTTHEARARNAKAQALAAILHIHGATVANVLELPAAGWSMVAELATHAELMGPGRKVHAPNSQATIDAVARILGDLIAHRDEQAVLAEQVAPQPERPIHFQADASHVTCGALMRSRNCPDGWDLGTITLDWMKVTCGDCYAARPIGVERTARDSVGYRQQMARIAPQPETTEADLFATFPTEVNR